MSMFKKPGAFVLSIMMVLTMIPMSVGYSFAGNVPSYDGKYANTC